MLLYSQHQFSVVDVVEEPFDVKIYHPVQHPAVLTHRGQCLVGILPRTVSVRMRTEYLLKPWFQIVLYNHLCHSVADGGDTQFANFSVFLGYLHFFHRWRKIAPR